MKKHAMLFPFLVTLALSGSALAQQKVEDMKGMDMGKMSGSSAQTIHQAAGIVKKLDAKAGSLTLVHEPVPSMNWPAMTMTFKVQSPAMLNELAVGQKVQVAFIKKGADFVITKLVK